MNSYPLKGSESHYYSDADTQTEILTAVLDLLKADRSRWVENITFGLDDQEPALWYATAYCHGGTFAKLSPEPVSQN
jgi:hypothetical protein